MQSKDFVNVIKKKEIKVSVIIPVYNVERYLERCLESVICQTLDDIEIIIVNDGSTDESCKIIENFLADKRVIYTKQENKGLSAARNKGMSLAKGEYISFIDSDDYIDNDFLEKLYKAAKRHNADITASSIIRKRETFEKWRIHYEKTLYASNKTDVVKLIDFPNQSYVWNKLYKKELLDSIGFEFEEGVFYEDTLALLSVILNCEKLVCVPDINYYYMVNDGNSIVKSKKTEKKEADRYRNQKKAIQTLIENNIPIKKKEYYIKKKEIKWGFLPILKIKENLLKKKELFLLFNCIPVFYINQKLLKGIKSLLKRLFSITIIGSHISVMFLFLKFNFRCETRNNP